MKRNAAFALIVFAALLGALLCFGLAGCARTSLAGEDVIAFAKARGATQYDDATVFADAFLPGEDGEAALRAGVCTVLEGDSLAAYLTGQAQANTFNLPANSLQAAQRGTVYLVGDIAGDAQWVFQALSLAFATEDEAAAAYRMLQVNLAGEFAGFSPLVQTALDVAEGKDVQCTLGYAFSGWIATLHEGIYLQGDTVLLIISMDAGTDAGMQQLTALCEELRLDIPGRIPA